VRLPLRLEAFRERRFRLLFSAHAFSLLGDNVVPVALAFAVLDLTGSVADLGLVLAARQVPLAAFVLVGGVWGDRLPRHAVMVGSDLVRLASQGLLAGLLIGHQATLWELAVLQAVHGTATAFFRPAATGVVPQTVSAELLQAANAMIFLASSSATIVGPAISGALVAAVGPGWALAVDAASFGVSASFLARLDVRGRAQAAAGFLAELAAGWNEVRSRTWLWSSIMDFALFQFVVLSSFLVLGPAVAKADLGGASAWAAILACFGGGSVAGALAAMRVQARYPLRAAVVVILGMAPVLLLLGAAAPTPAIAAGAFVGGAALSFCDTLWVTTLQSHIPADSLSRVSAYDWMGSTVLFPLGLAVAGPVAAAVGIRETLFGACAFLVVSSCVMLSLPAVRHLRAALAATAAGQPAEALEAVEPS